MKLGKYRTDRRKFLAATLASGVALSTAGCIDNSHRPFYSADSHPADYPTVQAVQELGRLLKERSNGRLGVKIFAGGQLGSERDTLELTSFGGLDMNRVNLAPLNSIEPMTAVLALPFLFKTTEHLRKSLDGEPGETILKSLEPHGLIGLCYYDSGARSFYNTKHPIQSPADMKGMKIRVPNSDLYLAMIKGLGADPVPMSLGDVYQSLVQGVIDGAENNWPSYDSGSHYEAAKYYSISRHVMAPEVLIMSKSRWDKLTKEDQIMVRQAAKDSVPYMRKLWDVRVKNSEAKLLKDGVIVNEINDLAPFVEHMRPVWDRFIVTDTQKRLVRMIEEMGET